MNEVQHWFPGSLLLDCLDCCIHPSMSHSSSQDMACIHSLLLGSSNFFFSSLGLVGNILASNKPHVTVLSLWFPLYL